MTTKMKGYEQEIAETVPSTPKVYQMRPLMDVLVELEGSAEIHVQGLKAAMLRLTAEKPELKHKTPCNGAVFVNLRAERVGPDCSSMSDSLQGRRPVLS